MNVNTNEPLLLAHSEHFHQENKSNHTESQESHQEKIKTVNPGQNLTKQAPSSPIVIKMDAQSQAQTNNIWGVGEVIFVLLVISPLLLSSLKKIIHR
ncbi:hypothetical protein VB715_14950 [Crocosphaera sp. UHCC 0190]|uniref:hypothetical protein n=1 Tax=Crocosphaera sp. UHCC 0190 TaxID=3110246 RepID=UPI002B20425C|nr:hypothetical protein [Crocosphaera sp. UHCC 0190]MEA5511070.1 hypothetical protein [Crocosphaera sp. UHCC 0190]